MGMTLTQKILAAHAGLDEVKPGQLINAKLDIVLGNDITTPVAINEFERAGFDRVFDKEHIAIVLDHFVPNKDIYESVESACRNDKGDYYEYPLCMTANCMAVNMTKVKEVGADKYIDTDKHTWSTAVSYTHLTLPTSGSV